MKLIYHKLLKHGGSVTSIHVILITLLASWTQFQCVCISVCVCVGGVGGI